MKKINLQVYLQKRKQRVAITGLSPQHDWIGILIIGGVLFILGAFSAFYLYKMVDDDTLFNVQNDNETHLRAEKKQKEIEQKVEFLKTGFLTKTQ